VVNSRQRRERVTLCRQRGHSVRRACELTGISRLMLGYRAVRPGRDVPVVRKMRELPREYPRLGCRMIRIFLGRSGHAMNLKRTYRLLGCGEPAVATEAASAASCRSAPPSGISDWTKSRLDILLRVRSHQCRTEPEMRDHHRRVHPR
jgi:hypothetical protein